ncbi:MAG: sugar phosphate nucleotidyltransferase [Leptospiraceae bacterium]|nr:sugar phosphate nucleotidyltransferase [Leptospiraceae bacterium]
MLLYGVIAAAGKGTRAYPRTTYIPKPLFRIENKSILVHNLEILIKKLGVEKIYVLVGHLKEQVIAEVEEFKYSGFKVAIETVEWTTKGLASDVASLENKIDSHFITILGDEFYYKTNHEVLLETYKKYPKLAAAIGVVRTTLLSRIRKNYSVELDGDLVKNLIEKPDDPPNNLLGLGTYIFSPEYFEFFKKTSPSLRSRVVEITEVIDNMAKQTNRVYASMLKCEYYNINSMQDYHHAVYEIRNDRFQEYKTSLILPTQNHERSLADVIIDFKDKVHEIVVVDAISQDKTLEIAKSHNCRIEYYYYENKTDFEGIQIRQGIEEATGDIFIIASPNGNFRSKDIPKLLEYIKDCDMVIGTRTTRQMIEQGSNMNQLNRLVNIILGKLIEIAYWGQEPRFTDVSCKFFAIWRDSYLRIKPFLNEEGKNYLAEMMIELVRSHMRVIEIPVTYYKQVEKEDYKIKNALSDIWNVFKLIHKKKWQEKVTYKKEDK